MENEESLIKKIVTGEKEFFGELLLKYQDFIFNVVKNYVKFEEEAIDITQEVFVKAYENINKFRGDSKFSSWLYRIAYNLSINWSERKRDRETQMDEELVENLVSEEDPVDKAFEKELLIANLNRIIEEIPEKYRIVINLYYFKEKSYQEIANILNIPINTVKIHLLRDKKMIETRFESV